MSSYDDDDDDDETTFDVCYLMYDDERNSNDGAQMN